MPLFPARQHYQRWLTLPAIERGTDALVLLVALIWALLRKDCDSVRYQMTAPAAKRYRFHPDRPVSFDVGGKDQTNSISWAVDGDSLIITVNPDDAEWEQGKATFYFVGINGKPNPPPFDPVIRNTGGPRT